MRYSFKVSGKTQNSIFSRSIAAFLTATLLAVLTIIAPSNVTTSTIGVSSPKAMAQTINIGDVLLAGEDWLSGNGVDIYYNGSDFAADWGLNHISTTSSSSFMTGYKWQCVELINRLYAEKGWISSYWPGNGHEMHDTAPSSLSKSSQGQIESVSPGDVLVWGPANGNIWGHVGIIDSIKHNGGESYTIYAVNQNTGSVYSSHAWNSATKQIGNWGNYALIGVVHSPENLGELVSVSRSSDSKADMLVRRNDGEWRAFDTVTRNWTNNLHTSNYAVDIIQWADVVGDSKADMLVRRNDGEWRAFDTVTRTWTDNVVTTGYGVDIIQWGDVVG